MPTLEPEQLQVWETVLVWAGAWIGREERPVGEMETDHRCLSLVVLLL